VTSKILGACILIAISLGACSPRPAPAAVPLPVAGQTPFATNTLPAAAPTSAGAPLPSATIDSGTNTPVPVVTSRGDKLEATDPDTVSLASGGLQFVEFFAFW